MELVFIDIEASGLGADSYPIEVAWKREDGAAQDSFLLNPEYVYGWDDWDEIAEDLHGISQAQLHEKGLRPDDACHRLNQALRDKVVVSDAPEYDLFWLERLFDSQDIAMQFTLRSLQLVLNPLQYEAFGVVGRIQFRSHRALDDVEHLIDTYQKVQSDSFCRRYMDSSTFDSLKMLSDLESGLLDEAELAESGNFSNAHLQRQSSRKYL